MNKINSNFDLEYDNFINNSSYFENMNLDDDIKILYESLGYKNKEEKLNKLRNYNHQMYVDIISKPISKLPTEFKLLTEPILQELARININELLVEDNIKASEHHKILNKILKDIEKLESMLKIVLKNLIKTNDSNQSKLEMSRITCEEKNIILDAYKAAILEYANVDLENIYNEFFNQLTRRDKLRNVYKLILKYDKEYISSGMQKQIDETNIMLRELVSKYKEKIIYLNDLIMENSKYQNKLIAFTYYINEKLDYNEYNLLEVQELYKELSNYNELDEKIFKLENLFTTERENALKEEQFVKQKIGKKNISATIKYIKTEYLNKLNLDERKILISIDNENISESEDKLKPIITSIWKNELTSIYEYTLNNPYKFIVTNDVFKDEVIEAIFISDKIINKVDDYSNYELGFICSYNDNILSITENEKIPDNIDDDLSKLKTPIQLEEEFISFKVCNRIALNGYKTDIIGIYYIDDGDDLKYLTAVNLANTYKLPLIKIKK